MDWTKAAQLCAPVATRRDSTRTISGSIAAWSSLKGAGRHDAGQSAEVMIQGATCDPSDDTWRGSTRHFEPHLSKSRTATRDQKMPRSAQRFCTLSMSMPIALKQSSDCRHRMASAPASSARRSTCAASLGHAPTTICAV